MGTDQEFTFSETYIKIHSLRANAEASHTQPDWRALRKACEEVLRLYPNEWLPVCSWVQASGEIEGFQGLANGIDLIAGILSRSEPAGYDFHLWLRDKLTQWILTVPITGYRQYTYTTILNARFDPERAAAASAALSSTSELKEPHRIGLEVLASALDRLRRAVYRHDRPSYSDLVELPGRISAYLEEAAEQPECPDRPQATDVRDEGEGASTPTELSQAPAGQMTGSFEQSGVFLEIEGFKGNSTTAQHRGWIQVQSYRHNMQPRSPSIVITKMLDAASPKLYQACCTSREFRRVIFDFCRKLDLMRVLRVELDGAVISSITQETAAGPGLTVEEITLRYESVRWTYTQFGISELAEGVVATSSRASPQE
jgi:type VI secretion system secreted protein Hcp